MDAELVDAIEVGLPVPVMAAHLHLVDPGAAAVDGRDAVLDSRREDEIGDQGLPRIALTQLASDAACGQPSSDRLDGKKSRAKESCDPA
jgi:hypothetical protein